VVETTNLTDKTSIGGNGNGLRHSDRMVITERFKRVADDVIQYQFTVDDPVTYKAPFTMSMPLTPLSGGVILPYECHEGNGAVKNSLSAERAEDAAMPPTWPRASCGRAGRPGRGPPGGGLPAAPEDAARRLQALALPSSACGATDGAGAV
jgi:hypothetical protein